jgi:serine protease Do
MKILSLVKAVPVLVLLALAGNVAGAELPDFTALVEKNAPAIVKVGTTRTSEPIDPETRATIEQMWRQRFGDQPLPEELDMDPRELGASGSGFIIDSTGYIVTNHHVVEDAETITVKLYDQRELDAEVIGSDEDSDLALLKVTAENLPVVTLGDSSKLKVGEWVLAMGSPFGLQYSVAAGIISYMGRSLPSETNTRYVSYIQTDVAINPGHSGGPLFNLDGEVIGINSQIFTNSGGSIGLSFAIPVDVARNVVAQLRDTGSVTRGWVGVGFEDVSQALADAFNLDTPHGALVNRIVDDGPAGTAGIREGDIVVALGGKQIRTSTDLPYYVGLLSPGETVDVEIVRQGQSQVVRMTVGMRPREELTQLLPELKTNRSGLTVTALDDDTREQLGIDHGVLVEEVEGAAVKAGILPGDIIITLNNVEVDTPEALAELQAMLPSDRVLPVLVARGGQQSFFTIKLAE